MEMVSKLVLVPIARFYSRSQAEVMAVLRRLEIPRIGLSQYQFVIFSLILG